LGEDWAVDGAALIATAFTAAGRGATLAGGTEKISESLGKAKANRKALKPGGGQGKEPPAPEPGPDDPK
jgi:hypothetical protein